MVASSSKIENLRLQISARSKVAGNPLAAEFEITNSRFQLEAPKAKGQAPASPLRPTDAEVKISDSGFQKQGKMAQKQKRRALRALLGSCCRPSRRGGWTVDSAVKDRRYSATANRKSPIGNRQ
jgi:hypothetical protein